MQIEKAKVLDHVRYGANYHILTLQSERIASEVIPGQFIHILVPRLDASVLRRPFSVFDAQGDRISVMYKEVGKGTAAMVQLDSRDQLNVIGPLGNGFPPLLEKRLPLLFLAARLSERGLLFVGAAKKQDILMEDKARDLGWKTIVATDDGSAGIKGLVTDALRSELPGLLKGREPVFFVCGPDGMMRAVGEMAVEKGWQAWLSLDRHMGCGIGACLACVQRIKDSSGHESWKRVCKDGPIFDAANVVWDQTGWNQ
jgi:dihydroorotate dehydrogenase electron transfer subunit